MILCKVFQMVKKEQLFTYAYKSATRPAARRAEELIKTASEESGSISQFRSLQQVAQLQIV